MNARGSRFLVPCQGTIETTITDRIMDRIIGMEYGSGGVVRKSCWKQFCAKVDNNLTTMMTVMMMTKTMTMMMVTMMIMMTMTSMMTMMAMKMIKTKIVQIVESE